MLYSRRGAVWCVRAAVALYAVGMLLIAAALGFAQVFAGRVVCGLGVGLGFAICPQYIAEISPPPWRGRGVVQNKRSTDVESTSRGRASV